MYFCFKQLEKSILSRKVLFLFTASFPFGNGESFIENEMDFLYAHFDKIVIITNNNEGILRYIPANVVIEYFPYNLSIFDKIRALKEVFNPLYINEKVHIKKTHKLHIDKSIRNILITSIYKAKKINKFINLLRLKYSQKHDNIYLYSYWMNDMAIGCAFAKSKDKSLHFLCRAHGWDVYFERHTPRYLPLRNYIAQQADRISFISNHGLNYFVQKNEINNKLNLNVSYLGTTLRQQKQYNRVNNIFRIVSCSSIIPLKQVDKLADALSLLESRFQIEWTHLGGGSEEAKLREKTGKLFKDKSNIRCTITGNLSNKDVINFYDRYPVDLFVNTSIFEGLPVSIMEAFSYGVPAIAPDIGGISEIIDNNENGFIFSPTASSQEIAECITSILEMPDIDYLKLRQNALKKWQSYFDAQQNYKLFVEYFI